MIQAPGAHKKFGNVKSQCVCQKNKKIPTITKTKAQYTRQSVHWAGEACPGQTF